MSILEINSIIKDYEGHRALNNVNINIPEGKIFGMLGPNGAGKTTLLRIINRIIIQDSGEILFRNKPITDDIVRNIGYMPEERGLYKKNKAGEQAIYFARLKGLTKNEAKEKVKYWFKKLDIESWYEKKIEELSKGMAQKIQFVITVIHNPDILIFDEPFSGFDPINTNQLKNEILELKETGKTIIFSTHNMASVEEICDNIALINKSEKIIDGTIDEVKNMYREDLYELVYDKSFNKFSIGLSADFEIIEIKEEKEDIRIIIKNKSHKNTNELLTFFMQHGIIKSFKEIKPSINDIFIRAVECAKKEI